MMDKILLTFLNTIIGALILLLAVVMIETFNTTTNTFEGIVIDKHYKSERKSVGVGTAVGSNGRFGVVTTTEIDPEDFLLMVQISTGDIITSSCEPELYYKKKVGDVVKCQTTKGKFLGWFVSYKAII